MNSKKILHDGNPLPAIMDTGSYNSLDKLGLAAGVLSCSLYAMTGLGIYFLGRDLYNNSNDIPLDVVFAAATAGLGYASAYAANFFRRESHKNHEY